ncbi:MAG: fumC [Parachlamydiales bacterium]|nr:fumC [Parachlamydiales bacterium]
MKEKFRTEKDTIGEVHVAADRYWGAQTERSRLNFKIGGHKMPIEIIRALAVVKKASAIVNCELKLLSVEKKDLIARVCDEIIAGQLDDHFPLVVWQTGSGTQTNMNVNEVISNRAIELSNGEMGCKKPIHPNDDVNLSQSSNDVFPTAMNIAAVKLIREKLTPKLTLFYDELEKKTKEWAKIIKVGRTHLMDATPITLGQEFSGYASQMKHSLQAIEFAMIHLSELALGGTAVGTGMNTKEPYAKRSAEVISHLTGLHFVTAPNKFEALAARDSIVAMSAALRQTVVGLMKIANDIRWSASGPRCGIGELLLPVNEPGSSIMPGKVNPTQCEAVMMVAAQVMGNDAAIAIAGSMGNFELNVFKPVMIHNLLGSIHLIADAVENFNEKCLKGIRPNVKKIQENLEQSLMLATALNTKIGYEKASAIVKKAYTEDITLKSAATQLGFLTEKQFDEIVNPKKMISPNIH